MSHQVFHKNSYKGIEPTLIQNVRRAVACAARKVPLTTEDQEDMEQYFMFGLFDAMKQYNPERGAKSTLANAVLDNLSITYFRSRFAQCRDVRAIGESLNQDISDEDSEICERIDFITEADVYPWRTGLTEYEHADIRHDLAATLTALTPRQCEIAAAVLKENTIAEAASKLSISRQTIYSTLSLIKRHFSEFGLESYIE